MYQFLREVEKEIKEGTLKAKSWSPEELRKLCGFEPEEVDPHEDELLHAIRKQIFAYNDYQRKKQMKAVIAQYCL